MSSFTATTDTSTQEYGNIVTERRVYRFSALLLFDKNSFGISGLDVLPRFLIKPTKLLKCLDYSNDGNSTTRGYVANNLFGGSFVKNTGLSDKEILFEFNQLKTRAPFGFTGQRDYKLFVNRVFDAGYQNQLQATWNVATNQEIKTEDHEYISGRTVETKEILTNYFDRIDQFLPYDYEGNKSKGVYFV